MDEMDKHAYEEVCRALVGWQGGFRDRDIETVADEILAASGLTSKLAALEDENKTLRELATDATAHLVGAASAYRKYAKRHKSVGKAEADSMFATRAADFDKAAARCQAALSKSAALPDEGKGESGRCKVPAGQTPLNDDLNHPLLDVYREGQAAREAGASSPYHGHSLEHCLHAAGWVARDLRVALDAAKDTPPAPQPVGEVRDGWKEIDLSRGNKHDHPDLSADKLYLVKVYGGWFFGPFTRQWYGWNFDRWGNAGCQFDTPGYNSSTWERIIEIDPEALSASPSPAAQEDGE